MSTNHKLRILKAADEAAFLRTLETKLQYTRFKRGLKSHCNE